MSVRVFPGSLPCLHFRSLPEHPEQMSLHFLHRNVRFYQENHLEKKVKVLLQVKVEIKKKKCKLNKALSARGLGEIFGDAREAMFGVFLTLLLG